MNNVSKLNISLIKSSNQSEYNHSDLNKILNAITKFRLSELNIRENIKNVKTYLSNENIYFLPENSHTCDEVTYISGLILLYCHLSKIESLVTQDELYSNKDVLFGHYFDNKSYCNLIRQDESSSKKFNLLSNELLLIDSKMLSVYRECIQKASDSISLFKSKNTYIDFSDFLWQANFADIQSITDKPLILNQLQQMIFFVKKIASFDEIIDNLRNQSIGVDVHNILPLEASKCSNINFILGLILVFCYLKEFTQLPLQSVKSLDEFFMIDVNECNILNRPGLSNIGLLNNNIREISYDLLLKKNLMSTIFYDWINKYLQCKIKSEIAE